ncbi:hypothetical protein like AT1G72160 [Hibiscus trionum]|uniref:Patellin-3 n=1 Tax=Hibiscus trionum TaxID=183268 RepID=A0A9W7M252_HIBTR|nr:hypothetical protein like AT1G72160 [Hibiscus trionum]
MADETPPLNPPLAAAPPPTVIEADSASVLEKEDPSPPSQVAAVSVSVTESVSTTIAEKEEQTPPLQEPIALRPDSTDKGSGKEELPPTPPPQAVESESQPPAVTETPKEEAPPAPTAETIVISESKSQQEVDTESETLAAVIVKDEDGPPPEPASASTKSEEKKAPHNLGSFKEESNKEVDLSDIERKALVELKQLVKEAIDSNLFNSESKSEENPEKGKKQEPKEVSIWGIPLLKDDRTDVILLKFLRARDLKAKDAFVMIKNTIQWRKEFGIDELLDEDLGDDMDKVVFMHGKDKEGHPVCYNVYGEFQNKELYQKAFSDEEKRLKFLRWRIQLLEKSIRKLDFSPGGVSTIFQVSDLKNSPGPGKRELRLATKQALQVLQDNYPEFVAKQVFINVPWWYLAFYTMISPFMTQRTKSKFVIALPAKSAETLFKYIPPEQVPIQYGGLSVDYCDCNPEFSDADPATEMTVKPGTKQTVEITIFEKCVLVWEIRVVGWEVSYGAEFVPHAKDNYAIIIQKPTKMTPKDEPVVSQSFKVSELGKVLLTVDNPTSKKKKLLYRFNVKPFCN